MWKKEEETAPAAGAANRSAVSTSPPPKPESTRSRAAGQATIGRSIKIRGDVTGDENLVIQGRIEGSIDLEKHNVTIGPEGRVKANLAGRMVTVEGEVDGDIRGLEQVALRSTSKVTGDIVAPRVVLEDGATFLGSIDMSGNKSAPAVPEKKTSPEKSTSPAIAVKTTDSTSKTAAKS